MEYEHYRDGAEYFHIGKNISHDHFHRAIELLYCIEKPRRITLDGVKMRLRVGELALVPPFCTHIFPLAEGHKSLCCVLPVSYTDVFERNSDGRVPLPQIIAPPASSEIYSQLIKLDGEKQPLIRNGIYTYIVGMLLKYARLSESSKEKGDFHMRALEYIEKHYDEQINISTAAAWLGYNRFYFSTLFNKTFGVHFKDYLNMVRINKSLLLLSETTAASAAHGVGYQNEQSYYSNFKKITGMTPREYRRKNPR